MASIVKRKKKYSVVYTYTDENGNKRQKWETFETNAEAKKRKLQVEYSYIAITNVVIVGMKIFFQEICFTNIHRIYQLSFFVEQAEFVV